jgi:glutamine amidotransferase
VIGVIDYRTGNAQSVMYALRHLDLPARLVKSPEECSDVRRLVLPGVGAADVTMASLAEEGWVDYLTDRVRLDGLPFLGICVGLQVLFEWSDEGRGESGGDERGGDERGGAGGAPCLGWLPGRVRRFDPAAVRVPHMGWNTVTPASSHPFVAGLEPGSHFYFVNSYYAVPDEPAHVAGVTGYGVRFPAIVAHRNIMATQFHAEKSGALGLRLLAAFAALETDELCSAPA